MKKMLLGLAAVFALSSFTPAFAEEAAKPEGDKAAKAPKKAKTGKKAEKPAETKDAPAK